MTRLKRLGLFSVLLASPLVAIGLAWAAIPVPAYEGTRFQDVWGQVKSDPYASYPPYEVSLSSFGFMAQLLKSDALRTLRDQRDVLPWFQKLIRPHGICLKGLWKINDDAPAGFTGYFKAGARGLIVARASVALTATEVGNHRAFGMAGKIFPTDDERDARALRTANFFAIDDNAGTEAAHFTDVAMTNQPSVTPNLSFLGKLPLALTIKGAQKAADSHEGVRQLYPISELGMVQPERSRGPGFLMIQGVGKPERSFADFRDELAVSNYPAGLVFKISVTDDRENGPWTEIGTITVDETVASESCDHRLHFAHPKWL